MRDRKTPDDEYNRRLHIYAETPGLQQPTLVPASEKELNAPTTHQPPPPSSSSSSIPDIQINPYARIPAANFVEEEEEDVEVSASCSTTGRAPSSSHPASSSSSSSRGASLGRGLAGGAVGDVGKGRDPIYAELDHQKSEDDQTENTREDSSSSLAANMPSSFPLRTSHNIPIASQNTNGERSRIVPPMPPSKRPVPLLQSSIAKKLDIGGGGPNAKTIRTHTRLDASLEIPATPRPKPTRTDQSDDGGGIKLIRKVDRNAEAGQSTSSTKKKKTDTTTTKTTTVEGSEIILTRVRSIDGQTTSMIGEQVNSEEETHVAMPVDPDLDAGTAIIKKKRRFRRNMILIIAFLMVLLIVVAAVIISLVIVTKAGRFW